jgi:hypothetical protein
MPARRRQSIQAHRQRIAAALAVLQQEVDVLPGQEAEVLVHRQPQADHRYVRRRPFQPLDPARNHAGLHALHLAHLDHEIGQRLGLAEERVALRLVAFRKIRLVHQAVVDLAFEDGAAAGAADAGTAAVRQHVPGFDARLQDVLAVFAFVTVPARFESNAVGH